MFPHFFKADSKILTKKLLEWLQKVIPDDFNVPEIKGAPPIEKIHRFWIMSRNKYNPSLSKNESNWNDWSKQYLINIIASKLDTEDSMAVESLIKNIDDFEKKNQIDGFSVFRDYTLESLIWIINNGKDLSSDKIKNIISICNNIDSKAIINLKYVCTREDYVQFLIETWLKTCVKPNKLLNLKSNKVIEELKTRIIALNWSSYFVQ